MITEKMKVRLMRVADFIAEEFEREASMTPSKEHAQILYRAAAEERKSGCSKLVRVWEEPREQ